MSRSLCIYWSIRHCDLPNSLSLQFVVVGLERHELVGNSSDRQVVLLLVLDQHSQGGSQAAFAPGPHLLDQGGRVSEREFSCLDVASLSKQSSARLPSFLQSLPDRLQLLDPPHASKEDAL